MAMVVMVSGPSLGVSSDGGRDSEGGREGGGERRPVRYHGFMGEGRVMGGGERNGRGGSRDSVGRGR